MNVRRECRLWDQRAPGDIAGIERRDLRQALLANGGADAVGGDQEIARGAAAVAEVSGDRLARLSEARNTPPAVVMRARECVAQHAKDALPGRENLRTFEVADQVARGVENFPRRDFHAQVGGIDAEPADAFDQVRLCDDTGAAAGQFALDPLEDIDIPAGPPQLERRQEPAHRAPDHQSAPLRRTAQCTNPVVSKRTKVAIYRTKPGGLPCP